MKLTEWANKNSVCYRTAWNHFKQGKIPNARQLSTGTIVIDEEVPDKHEYVVCYCRVSSPTKRDDLSRQAERVMQYATSKGYQVEKVIKEVASGLNDNRPKLNKLLVDDKVTKIVVEHNDRLTRFGFNYIVLLLSRQSVEVEVMNKAVTDEDDLMQDFVSLVTSLVARLYGRRRSKRRTAQLIDKLKDEDN